MIPSKARANKVERTRLPQTILFDSGHLQRPDMERKCMNSNKVQ